MSYHLQHLNRRSIQLQGYDYSQSGLYFITICIQDKECLFGKIEDGKMILNNAGKMVFQNRRKISIYKMPRKYHYAQSFSLYFRNRRGRPACLLKSINYMGEHTGSLLQLIPTIKKQPL